MNISLQPKRFINSQHTGLFTKVTVPYGRKGEDVELNIHYMDEGQGEPLILIHSIGQSLYTWRKLMPKISLNYRVIAIELMGHGYSDKPLYGIYSIEEHAEVIRLVMDSLNISTAHFLGFSTGCAYVCELMHKHPERVARAVLMSPGGVTQQMPTFVRMMKSMVLGSIAATLISPRFVEEALMRCFLDLTLVTPEMVDGYFSTLDRAEARRAVRMSILNYDEESVLMELRNVDTPTRILLGTDDRWHDDNYASLYQAALKNAEFGMVRNAGHIIHEEQPDKIVESVIGFIPPLA